MIVKTVHDECTEEILRLMREYDLIAQTASDTLAVKRELNESILAAAKKHKRVYAFKAGEKVEPEHHEGMVVLRPVGGLE